MKKNLSEILQSANAEALEGLFDSVKAKENPTQNTEKKPKNNQPIFLRVVAVAASFALLLSGAIILTTLLTRETGSSISPTVPGGTSKADLNDGNGGSVSPNPPDGTSNNDLLALKPYDASFNALARRADFNEIFWDAEAELPYVADDSPTLIEWNGLSLSEKLYNKLLLASDDDLFAVTVKVKPPFPLHFDDFVYEGKSIKEMDEELNSIGNLWYCMNLLKQYVDFTEEEKEANAWMIGTITEKNGNEFLEQYKIDGEFDPEHINAAFEQIDLDRAALQSKRGESYNAFIRDYPYLFRLVLMNVNALGYLHDNFVYSGYHKATDQRYEIAVMTKAQLASLRQTYKVSESWVPFNFETGYFTTVPCPEEDIAYAVNQFSPATAPSVPGVSDQTPDTIQE